MFWNLVRFTFWLRQNVEYPLNFNLFVLGHLTTHLGMPYLFLKLTGHNTLGYYNSKDGWNIIKYEVKNATFGNDLQCLGSWPVGCKINEKFEGLPILIL